MSYRHIHTGFDILSCFPVESMTSAGEVPRRIGSLLRGAFERGILPCMPGTARRRIFHDSGHFFFSYRFYVQRILMISGRAGIGTAVVLSAGRTSWLPAPVEKWRKSVHDSRVMNSAKESVLFPLFPVPECGTVPMEGNSESRTDGPIMQGAFGLHADV